MTRSHTVAVTLGGAIVLAAAALSAAALAADPAPPVVPVAPTPQIVKTSTLPGAGEGAIGLAALQSSLLPGTANIAIPNVPVPTRPDRLTNLGGIGSDLFRASGSSTNEFWMTTDRGPNGEVDVSGNPVWNPPYTSLRTYPTPWFTPTILHVRASGPDLRILEATPIVGSTTGVAPCTTPAGGLPNLGGATVSPADGIAYDDPPLAWNGVQNAAVAYTPSGLDTEGLVRAGDGSFWIVEEYSPSLAHVSESGCLLERIVPAGLELEAATAGAPITKSVPAVYQLRKRNRGFEALGLSPSGRYLFVGLQSPLLNPTSSAGNASRNTRILRYDLEESSFDAEYVYRFDDPATFPRDNGNPTQTARPQDLKVSGIVALDDDTLLVLERTDLMAKVYLTEVGEASNVLGTNVNGVGTDKWDCVGKRTPQPAFQGGATPAVCPGDGRSLEQLDQAGLDSNGIDPIVKDRLVTVIDARAGLPEKIEGLAVLNKVQIAVANDNDFDVLAGGDGVAFNMATGDMILRDPAPASQVLRIKLDTPLPLGG